jgi:hypothetical protein
MTTRTQTDASEKTTGSGARNDQGSKGLKETASGVADEAARTVETTAARGMSQVGGALHQVSQAVRESSSTLEPDQPQIAGLIAAAADKLDEAASFVSDRKPRELMDTAQDSARRQPALVIGGGLLAGLILGRVLRSAETGSGAGAPSDSRNWYGEGYTRRDPTASRPTADTVGPASGYDTGYATSHDSTTASGSRKSNGSERGRSAKASDDAGEG